MIILDVYNFYSWRYFIGEPEFLNSITSELNFLQLIKFTGEFSLL